ncbi:MAG: AAA family ATPase [Candidatus Omnitrophica bacterium]|nr:AAA family ATPase [Candidatus Omnitrophota bacterium]
MYFKKLDISGFKSFAERTILHFEPGITAIVGPNGCGKCLRYDSLVTLSDGSKIEIGLLVESALQNSSSLTHLGDGVMSFDNPKNINILSLNPQTLKIEPKPIYAFIKRKSPAYLLEIRTKSGKNIFTTHYHPFFTIRDGQISDLKAEELKKGVRIAVPRALTLSIQDSDIDLLNILKRFKNENLMYLPYSEELSEFLNNAGAPAMANISGAVKSALGGQSMNIAHFTALLDEAGIRAIPTFVKTLKSRSSGEITLPCRITKPIARFLGYLISEGRTTKENQVWFVNEDTKVVNDFIASARDGFGVEARVFNYKACAKDVLIFSSALCKFLENAFDFKLGGLSNNKTVPELIFRSENNIVAEFLSALFEGDGYVSVNRKGSGNYFEYATASKTLAEGISSLLLRFGVFSVIRAKRKYASNTRAKKKRVYYSVFIYGIENVKKMAGFLRFAGKKSEALEEVKKLNHKTNLNLDLIPGVNHIFRDLVKASGINVKRLQKICPRLSAYYENRCLPSRQGLLETLTIIAEHGKLTGFARSIFDYLKTLAQSDIYWDEVTSIKKVAAKEWVYDLSILDTHNFVAQDIIAHNSNIFDSIRWCLGEQSIKSLRGSQSIDVIFNGTETVLPQNMAEVSLSISNEAKILPIDYEEVTITRRLFRSGDSEYLINNNVVRLKDINELLMGTGIGAESYSLVEQGKIDLVISSKPEDRRLVFDEATGVSRYKAKKKEAMKKLEETDNNLLRVNDIITEVKRQIGSIERQASKARRYKEVFDKLKESELKFSSREIKDVKGELAILTEEAKRSYEEEIALNNSLQELDRRLILQKNELQELDSKLTEFKEEILSLENTNERNHQHITLNQDRIIDLTGHVELLTAQKEQLKQKISSHEKNITELSDQLVSLQEIFSNKEASLTDKVKQLNGLIQEIETAQNDTKSLKARIFDINLSETQLNNQLNENNSAIHTLLNRQRRLETEQLKTGEENNALSQNLSSTFLEIASQKEKISSITNRLDTLKLQKTNLESALKTQEEHLRKLENEKLSLRSQAEFLKELKLTYDNMPQARDGVLEISEVPQDKITGIIAHAHDVHFDEASKTYRIACELKFISFDLANLEARIEEISHNIEDCIRAMDEKEKELMDLLKSLGTTEEELLAEKYILTNKEAVCANLSDNAKRIQDELSLITLELSEVNVSLKNSQEKGENLKTQAAALKTELAQIDERINHNIHATGENNGKRENIVVEIAQLKTELANQKAAEDRLASNLEFFKNAYDQDTGALNIHDNEVNDSQQKITELNAEISELEIQIQANGQSIDDKTKEHSRLSSIRTEEINSLDFTQKQIIDLEEKIDKAKEDNHHFQMQEQELTFKHTSLKNRILQSYGVDLDETPMPEPEVEINMEALAQEIATLKEKVESFGTVNLVAIEELEELKNRHDFLTQQQNDLNLGKESLKNAILKINRTTRKMFLETFQIVAEEFKNYFKLLFGGGEAKLFLLDEEDVLESGIEIICRPPGKKLQNITLLSGGEKTLSAIALIFAIFKTKPSPFCVLDEIDAALDESNIDRFSRMLSDFSKTSQFIVITHNKKTIARANVMYGITMERSGMSKIVSVKLHENEHVKQSAEPAKEQLPQENPIKEEPSSETATTS